MFLVFLTFALFATIFPLGRASTFYAGPIFFTGTRMVLAGIILLIYQYYFHRDQFYVQKKNIVPLIKTAVFGIFATNVFEFWGLQYLISAKASFIYNLSPFVSALFSYFYFGEKMTSRKWLALSIGFLGFIPILIMQSPDEASLRHFFFISPAELALLIAAVATVLGWISMRRLMLQQYTPVMANGVSMLMGGVMALIVSPFFESWHPMPIYNFNYFIGILLIIMLISNFICYNLYGVLLRRYTATFMSFAGFTSPFFAAFFGWLLLGETVSWPFFVSSGIVLISLFLFYQEEIRQGYIMKPSKRAN